MKLITILGPTCSGKSNLAIDLARELMSQNFQVWVVSCDSKQVYKYFDIGTAKIAGKWSNTGVYLNQPAFVYKNIPHFLIDYVDPFTNPDYSVNQYIQDFCRIFEKQTPDFVILVGGTGLYAKNIYSQTTYLATKDEYIQAQRDYKQDIEKLSLIDLQGKYNALDKTENGYRLLNSADLQNRIRLVSLLTQYQGFINNWYDRLPLPNFEKKYLCCIKTTKTNLNQQISTKVKNRFEVGFLDEVRVLLKKGLSVQFLVNIGLDYRLAVLYFKGFLSHSDLVTKSIQENQKYAKRQITWFKKEPLVMIENTDEILTVLNLV